MYFILKMVIFQCYVRLPEGKWLVTWLATSFFKAYEAPEELLGISLGNPKVSAGIDVVSGVKKLSRGINKQSMFQKAMYAEIL